MLLFDDNLYKNKIKEIYGEISRSAPTEESNLMGGASGVALFLFYYSKYADDDKALELAGQWLEHAIKGISLAQFSLAGGVSGVLWAINHLLEHDYIDSDVSDLSDTNEQLVKQMHMQVENGQYDYLHEGLGITLYLLNNSFYSNPESFTKLVNLLSETAVRDKTGIRWPSSMGADEPKQVYNLSLSHGISSIVLLLSEIQKRGIAVTKTQELISGTVNYILNSRNSENEDSIFPNAIPIDEVSKQSKKSRLAWCYGDLGIGIALLRTSINIGDNALKKQALEILKHSASRRKLEETGVMDAGFCHGAIGNGHIFARAYDYTKEEIFAEASRFWFAESLKMGNVADGLAGFKTYQGEVSNFGLLTGLSGIGLSYISLVSDIDPSWDSCLLLS